MSLAVMFSYHTIENIESAQFKMLFETRTNWTSSANSLNEQKRRNKKQKQTNKQTNEDKN